MEQFEAVLREYGVDTAATGERFMGNWALYVRLLGLLEQDGNLDKLGEALERADLSAAFAAAHTLKGVAANMGLTPLHEALCRIVEPLRERRQDAAYPALYQEIRARFQAATALRGRLEGLLPSSGG